MTAADQPTGQGTEPCLCSAYDQGWMEPSRMLVPIVLEALGGETE